MPRRTPVAKEHQRFQVSRARARPLPTAQCWDPANSATVRATTPKRACTCWSVSSVKRGAIPASCPTATALDALPNYPLDSPSTAVKRLLTSISVKKRLVKTSRLRASKAVALPIALFDNSLQLTKNSELQPTAENGPFLERCWIGFLPESRSPAGGRGFGRVGGVGGQAGPMRLLGASADMVWLIAATRRMRWISAAVGIRLLVWSMCRTRSFLRMNASRNRSCSCWYNFQ